MKIQEHIDATLHHARALMRDGVSPEFVVAYMLAMVSPVKLRGGAS